MRILPASILCSAVFVLAIHPQDAAKPRVLDGTNVPVSKFPFVAKLIISKTDGQSYLDSGTLITPYHVLTAGHTVTDESGNQNITTDSRVYINGGVYEIAGYVKHPLWFGGVLDYNQVDASILILSSPVLNSPPISTYRSVPLSGSTMTIVGYGNQGTGLVGENGTFPVDGTVNYGVARIDSIFNTRFEWIFTPGESSIGHGDSGGPEFLIGPGGHYNVAGITSYNKSGDDKWYTTNGATRVDAIAPFIDSVVGFTNISASASSFHSFVAYRGQPFAFDTTLSNNSFNAAPPFFVRLYASKTGVFDGNEQPLYDAAMPYGLASYFSHDQSFSGAMPYLVPGAYTILYQVDPQRSLFESDTNDNFYAGSAPVAILDEPVSLAPKKKFVTNFKTPYKDSISITFDLPSDLQFFSKTQFIAATENQKVSVYVGGGLLGSATIFNGRGIGTGHMSWNYKKGQIQYTLTNASFQRFLLPYGATNAFSAKTILVPVWFEFNGVFYGTEASFFYVGTQGKTGKGS